MCFFLQPDSSTEGQIEETCLIEETGQIEEAPDEADVNTPEPEEARPGSAGATDILESQQYEVRKMCTNMTNGTEDILKGVSHLMSESRKKENCRRKNECR